MFVHVTPEVNAIGETISTLKFAERVGSIELGAARSNKEIGEIRDIKEEVYMNVSCLIKVGRLKYDLLLPFLFHAFQT